MTRAIDPKENVARTRSEVGFVPRHEATDAIYREIGFKCGLEVHQQLDTDKKLFCHCPSGQYQKPDDFDAEIVRHMRPTLSELGEYDGTALMEFKTRKNIFYRLKNPTACTYECDDTPPFLMNRQALDISMEIALLLKTSVVGEVHITRKQYLDGSIPTGFQRTAIVGINGSIPITGKDIHIIQISIEEDSCREVSDIRHDRIYRTDRLGMPLIETVTGPDMLTPSEAYEAGQYIRFLTRSSGKVRTGIGAARQDVNVSVTGGRRVEIKGVARISQIPRLTHNEAFRQVALLRIMNTLKERFDGPDAFAIGAVDVPATRIRNDWPMLQDAVDAGFAIKAVKLPGCAGLLSHFTGPGRIFADELADRLKVIACLEYPFMIHGECVDEDCPDGLDELVRNMTGCETGDTWMMIWGPAEDIPTALETIEERWKLAFDGIPDETRKSLPDGTTMFERVLPGPDRMYPDTDSAPIPVTDEEIEALRVNLPMEVVDQMAQMTEWGIPTDTFAYILRRNLFGLIRRIIDTFDVSPVFVSTLFGHRLKHIEGQTDPAAPFDYDRVFDLFKFAVDKGLAFNVLPTMLKELYRYPKMELDSVLEASGYRKTSESELVKQVPALVSKFNEIGRSRDPEIAAHWVMGQLHRPALGNVALGDLRKQVVEVLHA